MYSYGPPHMARKKQDDLHEHTFSSYVRIRDVALKTCQRWWTIGKSGVRGSGISVLVAQHDDDDDDDFKLIISYLNTYHHHRVALRTRSSSLSIFLFLSLSFSLSLSRHPSLSSLAPGRCSRLHLMSTESSYKCWSANSGTSMCKSP